MSDEHASGGLSPRERILALEDTLAQIRGILEHPVSSEDRDCALFLIGELVQGAIGDTPGISPHGDNEDSEGTA